MQGQLIIIKTDGEVIRRDIVETPDLDVLQAGVGGSIELVPLFERFEGKPCVVFCNEEGKLHGLSLNPKASTLWYDAAGGYTNDALCGDVVIITGDKALLEAM